MFVSKQTTTRIDYTQAEAEAAAIDVTEADHAPRYDKWLHATGRFAIVKIERTEDADDDVDTVEVRVWGFALTKAGRIPTNRTYPDLLLGPAFEKYGEARLSELKEW